jgi:hypothetical protein
MAAQGHPGLVEDEGPSAFRAGLNRATVATHNHRGRAAPVDDEDGLVAGRGVERLDGLDQRRREEAAIAGLELGAQVDDLDRRCLPGGSSGQGDPPV